jgi:transposase
MFSKSYKALDVIKCLKLYEKIHSFRKTAKLTGISKSTIHRWWNSIPFKKTSKKIKKHNTKRYIYKDLESKIKILFATRKLSYLSLKDIQNSILSHYKDIPSISTIYYCLKKIGVSRRRFNITKVNPRTKDEMMEKYNTFQDILEKFKDDEIVCIDETGLCNIGNINYGYFTKGQNPEIISVAKREKVSILMTIHPFKGIISIEKQKQAYNTKSFATFLKESLLPCLPDSVKVLLMDNVNFHKSNLVKEILDSKGIKCLYIPPYSPRCNPIEEVFSIMKRRFRKLPMDQEFLKRVDIILQDIKSLKDITPYYKHTRDHVKWHQNQEVNMISKS